MPTPIPAHPPEPERKVSLSELALAYLRIGLMGFGGVATPSRRVIVEERGWCTDEDYAAVVGVGQILPGANIINASVILGDRFQGPLGSVTALLCLLAAPLAILVAVASLYDAYGALPVVRGALSGLAAAAAGLVIGTGLKMARNMRLRPATIALALAALAAVALFQAPLLMVVFVLVPVGVALTFLKGAT